MNNRLLIIFAKNPRLGAVKTRLQETLGAENALRIYRELLDHTRHITLDIPMDKVIFYTEKPCKEELWDCSYLVQVQKGKDLGIRMENAFKWGFSQGYRDICIIGSDCFELNSTVLITAFEHLKSHEVVIGPSLDGGYYLLGMKELHSPLFRNKSWSSAQVMKETIKDLRQRKISFRKLKVLRDVDRAQDLPETLRSFLV